MTESKEYIKYIHIGLLVTVLLLPCITVGVLFGTGGLQLGRFPPVVCYAEDLDVTFYILILPISIIMAVGNTMLILIFHVLIQPVHTHVLEKPKDKSVC